MTSHALSFSYIKQTKKEINSKIDIKLIRNVIVLITSCILYFKNHVILATVINDYFPIENILLKLYLLNINYNNK